MQVTAHLQTRIWGRGVPPGPSNGSAALTRLVFGDLGYRLQQFWVTITSEASGLGGGMGVAFNRIAENISGGQGQAENILNVGGLLSYAQTETFVPRLAELVPDGCLGD